MFSPEGNGSTAEFFSYYIQTLEKAKAGSGLICVPSGNHDMPRLSYYCDPTQIMLVYAFMMSMPGVPFIYNGDEIGMRYLPDLCSVEGGYERTGTRTFMQWDDTQKFGFSSADPADLYIRQNRSADAPTVSRRLSDENSILNELKRLITVWQTHEALQSYGAFTLISGEYPVVYLRELGDEWVLIAINPTNTARSVAVEELAVCETLYSFNGAAAICDGQRYRPPLSAPFLRVNKD